MPETVGEGASYGSEPDGGSRRIVGALRVVTSPGGAIAAANERLPQPPQIAAALPHRLGGGFLFVLGTTVWRADRWLDPAKPIFTSPQPVRELLAGLDRVYVRAQTTVIAIDGKSGQPLDLGPWPASPHVEAYAAVDGWRAAAIADMRGLVATFDAGSTWRTIDLPFSPRVLLASAEHFTIGGGEDKQDIWYELRADGSVGRLATSPPEAKVKLAEMLSSRAPRSPGVRAPESAQAPEAPLSEKEDFAVKIFGSRPLAAALEDGWPLTDGTAVIARDGVLARVRLSDGALLEIVRDAFPLESARCHPITLTRPKAVGAFGFVCAEPRGSTILYAYDPIRGRLAELRRFDKPRVVTSSGNGALAVRGPCAADGEPPPPARPVPAKLERIKEPVEARNDRASGALPSPAGGTSDLHPYCVLGHDDTWREIHVRGSPGGERVVVLTDGRIVVVSPPEGVDGPARITVLDKGDVKTAPVVFPRVANDVARVLRLGLWLDGFEERRTGVIGGWIEAGGVMLGLEISLDGKATPGQFIHDAGTPFVSGRYGLGWTASRRGYETTDGGMTWNSFELPDPLVPATKVERRACGPIGCIAYGWLRIGWGEPKHAPPLPVPLPYRPGAPASAPNVQLACEPLAPMPPTSRRPAAATKERTPRPPQPPQLRFGFGSPPVLGVFDGLTELPPFYAQSAPVLRDSERGLDVDVREHLDRYPSLGALARVYGWGPKTGDLGTLGRWQVKWLSPFAGWPEVRASLPELPPPIVVEMTTRSPGYGAYGHESRNFQLVAGDDAAHALLIGKRPLIASKTVLYELEADRAPVEVRRADGDEFPVIEAAVRAGGRWFVAAALESTRTPLETVVWRIEGGIARELVRVPRARASNMSAASVITKLARSKDGHALGLVTHGEPTPERATNVRWVLPIDLETGALGEPEPLGWTDLAGRTLDACTDDAAGWQLETSMPITALRLHLPRGAGSLSAVQARLRLTSSRACIERLAGTYDGQSIERATELARTGAPIRTAASARPGELLVTAMSAQTRFPLRCTVLAAAR